MGGTLPALLRSLRPQDDGVAPATGVLYAANTAGALAGTLATLFVPVPAVGLAGRGIFAGAVGLAVATAALVLDRRVAALPPAVAREPAPAARSRDTGVALALYAAAGGVALGYEVVWSELLVQFLITRTHAFAVIWPPT
jgi:spermidine synthase